MSDADIQDFTFLGGIAQEQKMYNIKFKIDMFIVINSSKMIWSRMTELLHLKTKFQVDIRKKIHTH